MIKKGTFEKWVMWTLIETFTYSSFHAANLSASFGQCQNAIQNVLHNGDVRRWLFIEIIVERVRKSPIFLIEILNLKKKHVVHHYFIAKKSEKSFVQRLS